MFLCVLSSSTWENVYLYLYSYTRSLNLIKHTHLTLESYLTDAQKRAQVCRAQFSSFYWHGSMLSCSVCGDRPKSNKRRKMWQRLCVICGEPFAMNSFWKCHGGMLLFFSHFSFQKLRDSPLKQNRCYE